MDYIDPRLIVTKPDLAVLLPEPVAHEHNALPQGMEGRSLQIQINDPNDDFVMEYIRFIQCAGKEVRFAFSSRRAIREAIDQMYGTSGR